MKRLNTRTPVTIAIVLVDRSVFCQLFFLLFAVDFRDAVPRVETLFVPLFRLDAVLLFIAPRISSELSFSLLFLSTLNNTMFILLNQYHFENKSIVFCTNLIRSKSSSLQRIEKSAATVSFATANCLNRSGTVFLF